MAHSAFFTKYYWDTRASLVALRAEEATDNSSVASEARSKRREELGYLLYDLRRIEKSSENLRLRALCKTAMAECTALRRRRKGRATPRGKASQMVEAQTAADPIDSVAMFDIIFACGLAFRATIDRGRTPRVDLRDHTLGVGWTGYGGSIDEALQAALAERRDYLGFTLAGKAGIRLLDA